MDENVGEGIATEPLMRCLLTDTHDDGIWVMSNYNNHAAAAGLLFA